jgi:5-keto 4-deoxyuronate isomerase
MLTCGVKVVRKVVFSSLLKYANYLYTRLPHEVFQIKNWKKKTLKIQLGEENRHQLNFKQNPIVNSIVENVSIANGLTNYCLGMFGNTTPAHTHNRRNGGSFLFQEDALT